MAALYFEIGADWDNIVKLRNEINKLEDQLRNFGRSTPKEEIRQTEERLASSRQEFNKLTVEAAKAGAVMENGFKKKIYDASQTVNGLTEKIIAQRAVVREATENAKKLGEAYREAVRNNKKGDNSESLNAYKEAKLAVDSQKNALFNLTQEQANARLAVKKLRDEYAQFKEDSGSSADAIAAITDKIKGWAATIMGGMGIKEFIGKVVSVRGEFENIETSLKSLLGGSEEKMQELLGQLKEYALISPLTTKDVASALQMMIGYGIDADKSVQYLKALGDISMGDTQHFNSLALAFSQMSAAGKLMGQDLNQMINAGFNPLQTMSEKTGKSIGELKEQMSKGAISAEMVQQAFIAATSEGGKFYGMAEAGSKTINGQLSMLEESFDNIFNDIGTKSEGVIISAISGATTLVENYETIGKVLAAVAATYGVYKAELLAVFAIEKIQAIQRIATIQGTTALSVATDILDKKTAALNATLMKNPYVLVAAAVVALGAAMYSLYKDTQRLSTAEESAVEAQDKLSDATAKLMTDAKEEQDKLDELRDKLSKAEKGTQEWEKVKQEVINQFGKYYNNLGAEIDRVGNLSTTYDQLAASARDAAKARDMAEFKESLGKDASEKTQTALSQASKAIRDYNKKASEKGKATINEADALSVVMEYINGERKPSEEGYLLQLFTKYYGGKVSESIEKARSTRQENNAVLYQFENNAKEESGNILDEVIITGKKRSKPVVDKKAAAKAAKEAAKRAKEQAKANKTYAEEDVRWDEQQARNAQERAYAIEQARIDGMSEGSAKTLEQLKLDHQKELDQIKKQEEELLKAKQEHARKLFEANPKNKNKDFTKTQKYADIALTDEEKSGIEAQTKSANIKYDKEKDEVRKQELDSMREYLKEYGTIQERRVALIQEWDEKIRKAQSEGERLIAVQQKSQAVQEFDNEQLKKSFDWEQMFGDIGNMSVKQLQAAKGQLKEKLSDGSLKVEDYKTIVEQIDKINDAIVDAQSGESIFFGLITEHAKERKKLEMEVAEAIDQRTAATLKLAQAQAGLDDSKAKINDMLIGYGMQDQAKADFQDISAADAQPIIQAATAKFGAGSAEVRALQAALDTLTDSTQQVTEAQDKLATATGKVTDAQNKQESQKGWQKQLSAFQQEYEKYAQNVESLPELTSALGIDPDSDFGQSMQNLANAASSTGQAMSDFASGNYIGAAANGLNAIGSFSDALGITGDSDKTLASDIEKLTEQNEALQYAVEELTDEMKDASFTQSVDIYKTQLENMQKAADNTQEIMSRSAAAYKSGWKGHHSSNVKVDKGMSADEWQRISDIVDKTVDSSGDFFKLTSSEMKKVAVQAPDIYAKIKNLADDGYKNASQYMDTYIEYVEKIDELTDAFNEKMTGISLDSAKSEMESLLQDLDSSFSDAADNIEGYLRNAIVSAILSGEKYSERLEDWYKDFSEAMYDETLTSEEAEQLKQQYLSLYGEMRDEVNTMLEATGLDSVASGQSSSYGESSSITQDQASEISGRLTAMQWSGEQRMTQLTLANAKLDTVIVQQAAGNNIADGIRDILAQSYLELQMINENTEAVVKPIKNISDKMDAVEKKIKNL